MTRRRPVAATYVGELGGVHPADARVADWDHD
jgi:hypothetical protein